MDRRNNVQRLRQQPRPRQIHQDEPTAIVPPMNKGLAKAAGKRIERGDMDPFKPKNLSTSDSIFKNDPLQTQAVLIEGIGSTVQKRKTREFAIDCSQYLTIVRSTYNTITRADRGMRKFLSLSMFEYYCVILLWKRIYYVLTEKGININAFENLSRSTPNMAIPDEIGYYLNGIGNIRDPSDRDFYLRLLSELSNTLCNGISGHYNRCDSATHIAYETIPAPFVFLQRIIQDMGFTQELTEEIWNLPVELTPHEQNMLPNMNLLGWMPSVRLTIEQMSQLEAAGFSVGVNEDNQFEWSIDIRNVPEARIPVQFNILEHVSGLLMGSKTSTFNNHLPSTATKGSVAQIMFAVRVSSDVTFVGPGNSGRNIRPIGARDSTLESYSQLSVHLSCAAINFRYRFRRKYRASHDSLCYTGPNGGAPAPEWDANADAAYLSSPSWNIDDFTTVSTNGEMVAVNYSERIRKVEPHNI